MAQLKDLIVNGATRLIGDVFVNKIQITSISAPTSAGGTTYGLGTSGQVLKTNGSSVYWAADSNSVTGVKGNAESSYRTGNVNLTPANIGALALSGGTMTGAINWGTNSLSEFSGSPPYILGIEAFANGGATKWKAVSGVNVGSADSAKWLMNRGTNVTVADSSWNHGQTGAYGTNTSGGTVWKQRWTQSGLTYTPSGGSATTLTDSGDIVYWLSQSATSNNLAINMAIDGYVYSLNGFKGSLIGNADTATKLSSSGTTAKFWRGDNTWSNTLSGTAAVNTALLNLNASGELSSGNFTWGVSHLVPNLVAGGNTSGISTGVAASSGNASYFGFHYEGSNSNDNYISIGMYGYNHLIKINKTGNTTIAGGLEIKGHIAGDSGSTGHGLYSGGGYHNAYNNIILHGDASTGSSGIAFISDKGSTSINQPSDRAFIQWHGHGVTTYTAEGTAPTLATSGENNILMIGVGNDATDQVRIQTPGRTGLLHQIAASAYVIPDTNNTTGTVGSGTQPVWVDGGIIKNTTYTLEKSVPSDAKFTDTTYSFTAGTSTLAWNSEVTLATVGGLAIKAKLPANPNTNTDTLVKQTAKTDNVEYKILSTTSASPSSGSAAEAAYGADFTINPSAKTITSPNFKVTSNATITYNTTTGCLEIIV